MACSHILRTDGGGELGFGHVNRCLTMASAIRADGGAPEIVLGTGDSSVLHRIEQAGHAARQLASEKRYDAIETLRGAAYAIFDFSHVRTGETAAAAAAMLNRIRDSGARSLVIDTIGRDCLGAMHELTVDILAIPYAGSEHQEILPGPGIEARGADYFVLDNAFLELRRAEEPLTNEKTCVLVTAGGSDPAGLTMLFLAALARVDTPLQLRIVIGPGFSDALSSEIKSCAAALRHDVVLINAPKSLVEEIFTADLALSASGLTKYELACAGTPCVLVSIDEEHHAANRAFADLGSCLDAGLMQDVTPGELATLLEDLIFDAGKRHDMAAAGQAAVDGKGLQRMLGLLND